MKGRGLADLLLRVEQWRAFNPKRCGICHCGEVLIEITRSFIGNARRIGLRHTEARLFGKAEQLFSWAVVAVAARYLLAA